jgi:hypothetical protein
MVIYTMQETWMFPISIRPDDVFSPTQHALHPSLSVTSDVPSAVELFSAWYRGGLLSASSGLTKGGNFLTKRLLVYWHDLSRGVYWLLSK